MQFVRNRLTDYFRSTFNGQVQKTIFSSSSTSDIRSHSFKPDYTESTCVTRRPLWFVFSGLGSQDNQIPKELWSLEPFAESMEESRVTLRNLGIDLDNLLRPSNDTIFTEIRSAFACSSSLQLALYDTLRKSFDIQPSGLIGHSAGELLCGYADECLTAEQVLVISDIRGRAMQEGRLELGAMAAVGLSWNDIRKQCPANVYPACNNAAENVTVSGSLPSVINFVEDLQRKGIFAKMVDSCNYSPHSPLAIPAANLFRKYLEGVVPKPKARSDKWICTSAKQSNWHLWDVSHCTEEYFVRNYLEPVWFYEALLSVPNNAVVVEVSPKCIFQGILKQALPKDCIKFIPVLRGGTVNPLLYSEGCSRLISTS